MKYYILILCLAALGHPAVGSAQTPTDVTMIQLLASPDTYHGKLIRVIGYLHLEFEGDTLYPHAEDYKNALLGNGVWVDATEAMEKSPKAYSDYYVLLEGTFDSKMRGHGGAWGGTIKDLKRVQFWSDPKKPKATIKR